MLVGGVSMAVLAKLTMQFGLKEITLKQLCLDFKVHGRIESFGTGISLSGIRDDMGRLGLKGI